jgi:hypothetical protein
MSFELGLKQMVTDIESLWNVDCSM